MSLFNILISNCPETDPCGNPEGTSKGNEKISKIGTENYLLET